ncbi:MAG: hypothetical protein WBJ13_08785 [Sedimentibacter sp.]
MIIRENRNTPVAAPQMADMSYALTKYQILMENDALTISDLVLLLKTPGIDRDYFLSLFHQTITVTDMDYVQIIYS